ACEYLKPASQDIRERYDPKNVPSSIQIQPGCGRNAVRTARRSGWNGSRRVTAARPPAMRIVLTQASGYKGSSGFTSTIAKPTVPIALAPSAQPVQSCLVGIFFSKPRFELTRTLLKIR